MIKQATPGSVDGPLKIFKNDQAYFATAVNVLPTWKSGDASSMETSWEVRTETRFE